MDTVVIVAVVVVVIVALLAVAYAFMSRRKQSGRLRERFGPEYDRAVSEGKRSEAEKELAAREARVQRLHIKEIPEDQRQQYADSWKEAQTRFVDDPTSAVSEAHILVQRVMEARGYPITDFEQQAADISVDHPEVVKNYRAAHIIAAANSQNTATTEDLRQAMVHYRALFAELLGVKRSLRV